MRVPRGKRSVAVEAIIKNIKDGSFSGKAHHDKRPSREDAENAVRTLIAYMGEDQQREGLIDTPKRVIKAYEELFGGYDCEPVAELTRTFEEVSGYQDAVTIKNISFFSHCEHHMVPIIGKAHVSYIPNGRVVGLSKIARLVDIFAKRLQTQESMTAQICQTITKALDPKGVAVAIEAEHMCMAMRGIKKQGATTLTSTFTGQFQDDSNEQLKFMIMIGRDDLS